MKLPRLLIFKMMVCCVTAYAVGEADGTYEAQHVEYPPIHEYHQIDDIVEFESDDLFNSPAILSFYLPKDVKLRSKGVNLFNHMEIYNSNSTENRNKSFKVQENGIVIKETGFYRINVFTKATMDNFPDDTLKGLTVSLVRQRHPNTNTLRYSQVYLEPSKITNINFYHVGKLLKGDRIYLMCYKLNGEYPADILKDANRTGMSIEKVR